MDICKGIEWIATVVALGLSVIGILQTRKQITLSNKQSLFNMRTEIIVKLADIKNKIESLLIQCDCCGKDDTTVMKQICDYLQSEYLSQNNLRSEINNYKNLLFDIELAFNIKDSQKENIKEYVGGYTWLLDLAFQNATNALDTATLMSRFYTVSSKNITKVLNNFKKINIESEIQSLKKTTKMVK